MKVTKRKLRKMILESIDMQNHNDSRSVTIVANMVIKILESFEEMGYMINEVPMWEVVSAMTEKIEVNPSMLNTFSEALKDLSLNANILQLNDYFESSTLIYILKESLKDYKEFNNSVLKEELKRLSYVSKEDGFTYGIDHVSNKDQAAKDIIGHT